MPSGFAICMHCPNIEDPQGARSALDLLQTVSKITAVIDILRVVLSSSVFQMD